MNVIATIVANEPFEIEGKSYVKLQGFINGLGVFKYTVREELVPDSLEGKECILMFSIGVDGFCKPKLCLKGISIDKASIEQIKKGEYLK